MDSCETVNNDRYREGTMNGDCVIFKRPTCEMSRRTRSTISNRGVVREPEPQSPISVALPRGGGLPGAANEDQPYAVDDLFYGRGTGR